MDMAGVLTTVRREVFEVSVRLLDSTSRTSSHPVIDPRFPYGCPR